MCELLTHPQTDTEFTNCCLSSIGAILIPSDAHRLGVVDRIVDITLQSLKSYSPRVEIIGSANLSFLDEHQVERIYPDLEEPYKKAFKTSLGQGPSRLVLFENLDPYSYPIDFYQSLINIKGKIIPNKRVDTPLELGKTIRSAIPLPGDRPRYEYLGLKITEGTLSDEDYVLLADHLVHSPENLMELLGLVSLLNESDSTRIFGLERGTRTFECTKSIKD